MTHLWYIVPLDSELLPVCCSCTVTVASLSSLDVGGWPGFTAGGFFCVRCKRDFSLLRRLHLQPFHRAACSAWPVETWYKEMETYDLTGLRSSAKIFILQKFDLPYNILQLILIVRSNHLVKDFQEVVKTSFSSVDICGNKSEIHIKI